MLQLYNKIWFTGNIPQSWLHSIVVPIPKQNNLRTYRLPTAQYP